MEKVYATEGITPEMLQHQRDQSQLLRELVMAEREDRNARIAESLDLIDETFFAMVSRSRKATPTKPTIHAIFYEYFKKAKNYPFLNIRSI